ncbi:MAG: hypothetical protein B7Z26_09165 [Asticcacaulis sp. 32-58-5]|nr:MAG: hypothetical protein B7Z26_09165 [Asticcacaulis sp. 32-58-5]
MAFATMSVPLMVLAQTVDPDSDLGRFRALRIEAARAVQASEWDKAAAASDEALTIMPSSGALLLLSAQARVGAGKTAEAKARMRDYLARGMVVSKSSYPQLSPLWDAKLDQQLVANSEPIGSFKPVQRHVALTVAEGLAIDPKSGKTYLSALSRGAVNVVNNGVLNPLYTLPEGIGAYGLVLRGDDLWVATSSGAVTKGYDAAKPAVAEVLQIDRATGQVKARFSDETTPRRFGDIFAGKTDLYVSDGQKGEVLRLNNYSGAFEVLIPEGYMGSPQGMVENEAGNVLVVSDYSSGLYRINLDSGEMDRMEAPANITLFGMDGLARYGNDIIAVQNGIKPDRIVRLRMSPDWKTISRADILVRGGEGLAEPTGIQVVANRVVFIARSQWSDVGADGAPLSVTPGPAILGEIELRP